MLPRVLAHSYFHDHCFYSHVRLSHVHAPCYSTFCSLFRRSAAGVLPRSSWGLHLFCGSNMITSLPRSNTQQVEHSCFNVEAF